MFSLTLLAAVLATSPVTTSMDVQVQRQPTSVVTSGDSASWYFQQGITAQAAGHLADAERAFIVSIALDRHDGKPAVDAAYALAHVQHLQGHHREAGRTLEELASLANQLVDVELEARARLDAIYLYARAHRPWQVRDNADRLTALAKHPELSAATRRRIAAVT